MVVRSNGKVIRTIPVSTGRSQYPTKGGVHIALAKAPSVIMDSATVGIPKGSPGYYYETVYWDVRISDGGAFVHAAPWSVAEQGLSNVSHGCVNISTANATWFYYFSQRGDIVDVYNSSAAPDLTDPGMADWNLSWKAWVAGDAAPTAAAKSVKARLPRDAEPGAPGSHSTSRHSSSPSPSPSASPSPRHKPSPRASASPTPRHSPH
jgi:hypothetical protein